MDMVVYMHRGRTMRDFLNNKIHLFGIACIVGILLCYPIIQELMRFNNPNWMQYAIIIGSMCVFVYAFISYVCIGWNAYEKRMVCLGYFLIVAVLLLARRQIYVEGLISNGFNPLAFIDDLQSGHQYLVQLVILNVLLFVPAPLVLQPIVKKKWMVYLSCLSFGILMEVLQYMLRRGSFDLSDISLYAIGIGLGMLCIKPYHLVEGMICKRSRIKTKQQ